MKNGYAPANTDYPSTVALFTSGDAAMMINGVWEVPTMTDLEKQGKLFNWGAIELPVFFNHPCTYADSHSFAIPNNVGKPQTPEKHAAVLEVIKWMEEHSLFWATAGHIPANKAVTEFGRVQGDAAAGDLCRADGEHGLRPEVEIRRRRLAAVRRCRQRLHRRRSTARCDVDRRGDRDEGHARTP